MQRLLPTALRGEFPVLAVPDGFDGRRGGGVLDRFERFYGADRRREEPSEGDSPMEGGGMDERRDEGLDVVHSGKVTIETLRRFQEIVAEIGRAHV